MAAASKRDKGIGTTARNKVSGSSTRKPSPNFDQYPGIPRATRVKGGSAVTQSFKGTKTTKPAAKRKVLG